MTVEFYYMPESPPCRLVEYVAEIAGVALRKNYINLFTKEHLNEEFIKINPRHKVPFIIDGNIKITESRAICCYLISKYMGPSNALYPADLGQKALIDELLFFDSGTLYQSSSTLFYPIFGGKSKTLNPESEKNFLDNLEFLDNHLRSGKSFLTGDHLTLADISIMVSLQLSEVMDYKPIDKFNHLKAFLGNVKAAIPRYNELTDKAMDNTRKYIQSKLNE